ncbi:hypothetical protein [Streptomyces sp. SPB074]|uniref:hypothetical protein n=1 Tax=Streptomyces sp. (strain SPB074) TaxID=465543 RepID=UPI00017FEBEF|nr:hypothetical protein [Streptomyces sp. SPB074]EDY44599.1 conserved hypothetical protein [Streptomyces sp. SPB074]
MSARNGIRNESRDVLGWLAMLACVVIAAHGEWSLAVQAGYQPYVAAALPVAVDAYAIRSMQAGREVLAPVLLMVATNAATHLVHAELLHVGPWLVVAVSAIAPVVLWRVHALRRAAAEKVPAVEGDHFTGAHKVISAPGAAPAVTLEREPEPAEPAPEPEQVPPAVEAPRTPVLGPLLPLAQLLAAPAPEPAGTTGGTEPEQHERAADERPEPGPEPAEPAPEPRAEPELPGGQFGEDIVTVRTWLAVEPGLSGTEIGTRLGKSDSYGRRVRRAAEAVAA